MHRYSLPLLLTLLLASCSDPADGNAQNDDSATGGVSGSTGGASSTNNTQETSLALTPSGPGRDALVGQMCTEFACDGDRAGNWILRERCDASGAWVDTSCPEAVNAWALSDASGQVKFNSPSSSWQMTYNLAWTFEYPASCGGCAIEASLQPTLDGVVCTEAADGSCSCTGSEQYAQDWIGSVYAAVGDGHWNFEERVTAAQLNAGEFATQHEFWTCAGQDEMIVYDENGARLHFDRVPQ